MSNVTPKVHSRLSHETFKLDLTKPCLNLWCMQCVQIPGISRNNYLIFNK